MDYIKYINNREIVNKRIEDLLEIDNFSLSVNYLCLLHRYLFKDIYPDNGQIRKYNIRRSELILNGDTVDYYDYHGIITALNMAFNDEKSIDYTKLSIAEKITRVAYLCARIWHIHPFNEGNTRLTALFCEKYFDYLGFDINNDFLRDNGEYFREALVRANYYDYPNGINSDNHYLIQLFKKMLLDKEIMLDDTALSIEKEKGEIKKRKKGR